LRGIFRRSLRTFKLILIYKEISRNKAMRILLLDTSLLLDCARHKLDLFTGLGSVMDGPYEVLVPSGAMGELQGKAKQKGQRGADARFALALVNRALETPNVREETSKGPVDNWLVSKAMEVGGIICTNDAGLRARARVKKLRVISVLHNSRLGYS
jgi:rRNA-processing protein FCF1